MNFFITLGPDVGFVFTVHVAHNTSLELIIELTRLINLYKV